MVTRREFLRSSAAGGFALGGLLGLGVDLRAAQADVRSLKIANGKEVPSVCPYCAVGCGQLVSVRDGKIVNIEGNPESPISRGTLCPKGAATFQLAVNPQPRHQGLVSRSRRHRVGQDQDARLGHGPHRPARQEDPRRDLPAKPGRPRATASR